MKKILLIGMVLMGALLIGGCKNLEQGEKNYVQFKDALYLNDGDVLINLTGLPEKCNSIGLNMIICGTKSTPEECWELKKSEYVGKIIEKSSCCLESFRDFGDNKICCTDYAEGYLTEINGTEAIDFEHKYYRCSFSYIGGVK